MKKSFSFYPYEKLGNIKFGFKRFEVRKVFDSLDLYLTKEDVRVEYKDHLTDVIEDSMFIYYGQSDECTAIELGCAQDEQNPKFDILFEEKELFQLTYRELLELVSKYDDNIEIEDGAGFTSYKLGLGVYCPDGQEKPKSKVESLIVFKKGYYDD